jgi:hypothetical protein
MADSNNHTGATIALVGGGALLVWLLLRGKDWGFGGRGGDNSSGSPSTGVAKEPHSEPRTPCQIFIRSQHIDLDGVPADLPAIVARCRAGGSADVRASGGASIQAVEDVIRALQAAGVRVTAPGDIWDTVNWATAGKR